MRRKIERIQTLQPSVDICADVLSSFRVYRKYYRRRTQLIIAINFVNEEMRKRRLCCGYTRLSERFIRIASFILIFWFASSPRCPN